MGCNGAEDCIGVDEDAGTTGTSSGKGPDDPTSLWCCESQPNGRDVVPDVGPGYYYCPPWRSVLNDSDDVDPSNPSDNTQPTYHPSLPAPTKHL